ncbi:DUF998 domain-containing protein [Christiangramia aquimixticola]|uniref:DUF998 domain-containing protein n=1 Tax=Christiangramia aquimixticola TaxID=1697558 RepID=UPI003AA8C64C
MQKTTIFKISGIIGLIGCIAVLAADLIGIAVHEAHNPIANTISMLAIGKYGWIQDWGLNILAMGYLAIAAGLYTLKKDGLKWIISLIILVLIAGDIIMIAEHNQYAGRPGENIHRTLVYILAGLFLVLTFLISSDIQTLKPSLKKFSLWIAGIWLVTAPWLPYIPDGYNGAYERLICSLLVIWPAVVSYHLIRIAIAKDS